MRGAAIVRELHTGGTNIVGFGEMGIGNTSSAAALMHCFTCKPLHDCVGRGTGLDDAQLSHKQAVLEAAINLHFPTKNFPTKNSAETASPLAPPLTILAAVGGFEIAMMCGAMLQAASLGMLVLVDGFIASSALLVAEAFAPVVVQYCIFSHQSDERGHKEMLAHFGAKPLLHLGLRLGEGTGAALAYPLVQAAAAMLNEMATFEGAGVDEKEESQT